MGTVSQVSIFPLSALLLNLDQDPTSGHLASGCSRCISVHSYSPRPILIALKLDYRIHRIERTSLTVVCLVCVYYYHL